MNTDLKMDFGFIQSNKGLSWSGGAITPHPQQQEALDEVESSDQVEWGWYQANASEVFRLPATHVLTVPGEYGESFAHAAIALFGWLNGVQAQPAGWNYLYKTPVDGARHNIHSFCANSADIAKTMDLLSDWWRKNEPPARRSWFGALRWHLQAFSLSYLHERFAAQYTAMDACYKLLLSSKQIQRSETHAARAADLCTHFSIECPVWACISPVKSELSELRNELIHEAIFAGHPIGFGYPANCSVWDTEYPRFVSVLLLSCIGVKNEFTKAPVTSYQISGFRYSDAPAN